MRKGLIFKLVAFGFALSLVPLINGCSEDSTTTPITTIQDTAPPAPPVPGEGREKGPRPPPPPKPNAPNRRIWSYCLRFSAFERTE